MDNLEYLHDERVALRPLQDADAPVLARWANDQAVLHFLGFAGGLSVDEEHAYIARMRQSASDRVFVITPREDGRMIGMTGLHGISAVHSHADFGILLGERDCWGQGYGTAACRLICDYGFNRLNLHRISLCAFDFNTRGIRSYEKIGFVEEGRLRQHLWRDGAYHDDVQMGLLREEFNAKWEDWRGEQRRRYGIGE
jgi:RimJ/RimL family protein N-acetyltransferase